MAGSNLELLVRDPTHRKTRMLRLRHCLTPVLETISSVANMEVRCFRRHGHLFERETIAGQSISSVFQSPWFLFLPSNIPRGHESRHVCCGPFSATATLPRVLKIRWPSVPFLFWTVSWCAHMSRTAKSKLRHEKKQASRL